MRFAIGYPIGRLDPPVELLTQDAVANISLTAERCGIDAVAFTEHPATPDSWRDGHGHDSLDPFIGLAFAAAATTRIRLLTFLVVVPYHNPFALAKATATLDRLSGGRLILGVGTGYLEGEFEALGVRFDERNTIFAEAMEVLRLAWTGQPVDHRGLTFEAKGTVSRPVPLSSPHPPVWLGGNSALTRRRVAQYGDGWMPIPTNAAQEIRRKTAQLDSIDRLGMQIQQLQAERERLGRLGPAEIKFMIQDIDARTDTDQYIDRVHQLEAIGVDWITLEMPNTSVAEAIEHLEWFNATLRPQVAGSNTELTLRTNDGDREQIIDLYRTYARALDQRRFELLRTVFTDDVVADYGFGPVEGIDQLVVFMVDSHREITNTRHRTLDFEIAVDGRAATCRASKRNTLTVGSGDPSVVVGQYVDELVRTADGWRISRRRSHHHQ